MFRRKPARPATNRLAVAAYNAGEGNIWKYNGVPPFRETVNYTNRIAKHIRKAIDSKQIADASR